MSKKAISVDERISTAEAAALLGKSPRVVRQHAVKGNLPGQRVGRDWIFRRGDVMRFKPKPAHRPRKPTPG